MTSRAFSKVLQEYGANTFLGGIAMGVNAVTVVEFYNEKKYTAMAALGLFAIVLPVPTSAIGTYSRRNEIKQWIYAKPLNPDKCD